MPNKRIFAFIFIVYAVLLQLQCFLLFADDAAVSKTETVARDTEFIYDDHGKKDPFGPPKMGSQDSLGENILMDLRVEGIIWDEDNPIAVVNGKVVGVGDSVNGVKIIKIKQNEVIFDVQGKTVPVKLQIKLE
jgi:type II secretory pathway component PulC